MLTFLLSLLVATPDPPRLLVVDLDDLGREFLAANPQPAFDALDQHGRRYTRFYTAPVCSPTRALMHYGVRASHPDLLCTWLVRGRVSPYGTPTDGPLVPLPAAVAAAGFSTAKVGKWHLAPETEVEHPRACGWRSYVGAMGNVDDYMDYVLNVEGTRVPVAGTYLTALETDLGILAMGQGYDLVSVSYHAIHDPFHVPPPPHWGGPTPQTVPEQAAAMLEVLGDELDRLVSVALQLGYHVLVFSDNGGKVVLGGQKGSLLDKGIRTVAWAVGPTVVPGVDDSIVGVQDVYATVLDFFGIPRTSATGPESVSFLPTWSGQPGAREVLFQERFEKNGSLPATLPDQWQRGVVSASYKLVERLGEEEFTSFDESSETYLLGGQLSGAELDVRARLRRLLRDWTGLDGPGY